MEINSLTSTFEIVASFKPNLNFASVLWMLFPKFWLVTVVPKQHNRMSSTSYFNCNFWRVDRRLSWVPRVHFLAALPRRTIARSDCDSKFASDRRIALQKEALCCRFHSDNEWRRWRRWVRIFDATHDHGGGGPAATRSGSEAMAVGFLEGLAVEGCLLPDISRHDSGPGLQQQGALEQSPLLLDQRLSDMEVRLSKMEIRVQRIEDA